MGTRTVRTALGAGLVATLLLAGCGTSGRVGAPAPAAPPRTTPPTTGPGPAAPPTTAPVPAHVGTVRRGVSTWPGYHDDDARTAAVEAGPSYAPARRAWTATLGGVVHGQVVAGDGMVFAATEDNRVVALNPHDGRVVWSRTLGPPLTDVDCVAGCGDIDPLGITSTPVADTNADVVYVVGEVSDGSGKVHHQLEGLSMTTGAVRVSDDVDPPLPAGEKAVNLLQRASLALANGRIYISYGGNDGDCGRYHGWVVAVDQTGPPHELSFEVASDGQGGAVWEAGGAPAIDGVGDVYVTTGNANPDPPEGGPDPERYTESVVKLSPTLQVLASFKDEVAGGDEDLSTGNPVLIGDDELFAIGKTDIGYVLRRSNLSEVAAIHGVCSSDPDGGPAYDAATDRIYVPCKGGGIRTVDLRTRSVGPLFTGANGAPILIGTEMWAALYTGDTVSGYDLDGRDEPVETIDVGRSLATFTSPSTALGLLLVPTDTGVTAYVGSAGLPPSPSA